MYYVYVLKSKKDEKLYIGLTNDLKRRLSEHNNGLSRSTKKENYLNFVIMKLILVNTMLEKENVLSRRMEKLLGNSREGFPKVFNRMKGVGDNPISLKTL